WPLPHAGRTVAPRRRRTLTVAGGAARLPAGPGWAEVSHGGGEPLGNMAIMLGQINTQFAPPKLDGLDLNAFAPGTPSVGTAAYMGITDKFVTAYISQMPLAVIQSLRAATFAALDKAPRDIVTIAWTGGYDYLVSVSHQPAADG